MEKIAFIIDAACDLPQEYIEENNIYIIPFSINFSNKTYTDGVDITRAEFYEMMKTEIPSTSIASFSYLINAFKDIHERGIKNIIIMTLSSTLSSFYNYLKLAAESQDNFNIKIIDSKSASLGEGFPLMAGINAYKNGANFEEVANIIEAAIEKTNIFVYFKDLKNLIKGGRVPLVKGYIATALSIMPIIRLHAANLEILKNVRSEKQAIKFLKSQFDKLADKDYYLATLYGNDESYCERIEEVFSDEIANAKFYTRANVTPTLGVHVGSKFSGIVFMNL